MFIFVGKWFCFASSAPRHAHVLHNVFREVVRNFEYDIQVTYIAAYTCTVFPWHWLTRGATIECIPLNGRWSVIDIVFINFNYLVFISLFIRTTIILLVYIIYSCVVWMVFFFFFSLSKTMLFITKLVFISLRKSSSGTIWRINDWKQKFVVCIICFSFQDPYVMLLRVDEKKIRSHSHVHCYLVATAVVVSRVRQKTSVVFISTPSDDGVTGVG